MNFRLTAVLFGLVLVLAVVLLGISFLGEAPTGADTLLEDFAASGVKSDQIDAVEIERADPAGKLLLVRVGDNRWEIREPVAAKADAAAVNAAISALLSAKPVPSGETGGGLTALGLSPPSLKVTLRKGSAASATLNVGTVSIGGNKSLTFVSNAAHPDRPMAVRRGDIDALFRDDAKKEGGQPAGAYAKWTSDYRATRLIGPDPHAVADAVTSLAITAKGRTLTLGNDRDSKEKKGEGWRIEAPPLGAADVAGDPTPKPNAFTGVRPLLAAVAGIQALSAADFVEFPKDLKEYGLNADNPDLVRIEMKSKDGPAEVLFLGKKVQGEAGKVYARVEGDAGVVKAHAVNVDGFAAAAADPAGLRDRTLLDVQKSQIDALDVTANGQTTKLRRFGAGAGWTLVGGPHDPQKAGRLAADNLVDLLAEKRTVRDFSPPNDPKNDALFEPARAEIKLWTDAIPPDADPKKEPDLKDKKPTVLVFGKAEGDAIHVRRILPDGGKRDVLLPLSVAVGASKAPLRVLDAVSRTRLDFLDAELPRFATTLATKLTYARGAEAVELAKSAAEDPQYPNGRWTFEKPEAFKGRAADGGKVSSELLTDLATLTAVRFVAEEPKEDQLKAWGLDPKAPRLKAAVGFASATDPERGYEFGNETEDKAHVYARAAGRPEVFLVSKERADRFGPPADLRDPTVVAFDRARVKGLKLRGWRELTGGATELALEKKDGRWAATKGPANFALDPEKVEKLVNALFVARAKSFVPDPKKPEYGFSVDAQNGLEITLELDGGLPSLLVNVGAPTDGGQAYFVYGNQHPDSALVVPAEGLKPLKERPAYLAK